LSQHIKLGQESILTLKILHTSPFYKKKKEEVHTQDSVSALRASEISGIIPEKAKFQRFAEGLDCSSLGDPQC